MNGKETITIDVAEYIGQQAFLALERVYSDLGFYEALEEGRLNLTQTVILFAYQDYCYVYVRCYDELIASINELYKRVTAMPVM